MSSDGQGVTGHSASQVRATDAKRRNQARFAQFGALDRHDQLPPSITGHAVILAHWVLHSDKMAGVKRQPQRTPAPRPYRWAVAVMRPPLALFTSQDWQGAHNLPASGGFIVAVNHLSYLDPFTTAHFLVDHGYPPMFLAKSDLFEVPVLGKALPKLGQVPVYRNTRRAGDALVAAEQAVTEGKCVVIMPEGTLTREPSLWPMKAHTGIGRLALVTKAPVIPIGQWGPQELLAPYARWPRNLLKRPTVHLKVGPAVDLSDLFGRPKTASALAEASNRVMWAITEQVAHLRGEPMPAELYDRAASDQATAGQTDRDKQGKAAKKDRDGRQAMGDKEDSE